MRPRSAKPPPRWRASLREAPRHAGALNNRGVVHFFKGEYSDATVADSGSADAWYNLAGALDEIGDRAGATRAGKRFEELQPVRDDPEQRPEEIIAEVYRQIRAIRETGKKPRRIVICRRLWLCIEDYRRSLGSLSGPLPDYLSEDRLFGIEIWYGTTGEIRVE